MQIDSKVVAKIALGDIDPSEAKLLKVWCKKEEVAVFVNTTMTPPTTMAGEVTRAGFPQDPDMVTEYIEVGVEKCEFVKSVFSLDLLQPSIVKSLFSFIVILGWFRNDVTDKVHKK